MLRRVKATGAAGAGAPGDFAALIYQQFVRMKRAVVAAKIEVN